MPNITNIAPPRVPLTDPVTGRISREWYRFFLNLFNLTGAGSSDVSLQDIQLGPTTNAEAFAEINRVYSEALLNAPVMQLGTLSSVNQDNVRYLGFQTVPALGYTPPVGSVYWNGGTTLTIQNTPNVAQPVGEAQYFYIKATSAITKGQLIMFTGSVGASGQLTGAPATGVTVGEYLMGVAAEDIALNSFGIVTSFGLVRGFDTTGGAEAWVDGQILYYDPATPGKMTKTIPPAPNVKAIVAAVVNAGSGGSGSVFVRVSFGSKLGDTDSNVQITSLTDGDLLQYDSGLGYWKNIKPLNVTSGGTGLTSGTSGGVPYFSSTSTMASSAELLSGGVVIGGGAGATPYTPPLSSLEWDNTNRRLGINAPAPTSTLHVAGAFTDPGLNGLARFVSFVTATVNGINYSTVVQTVATISGGTTAQIRNYQYNLNFTNSGATGNSLYNVFTQSVLAGANSGTLTNHYSYYIGDFTTSGFTGSLTVSNNYGIRIANLANTITNVTKTNTYALYIDAQSGTTSTTRAIYSAGGASVHVGDFRFGGTTAPGATVDVTGDVRASGAIRSSTITALGTTGTVSLNPALGAVFTVTPTGNITLDAASVIPGQYITLVVTTSGTTSYTITFNTNFKTTGTLATGTVTAKVFTVTFVSNGTNYNEVSRTVAM